MAAVAHFPTSIDRDWLGRLRRPLAGVAAAILVVDLMGLGMHLADSATTSFANDPPTRAKTRLGAPEAVVPRRDVPRSSARAERAAEPLGCLALDSGCYAGPQAPGGSGGGSATAPTPPAEGPAPSGPAQPTTKPLAQVAVRVPGLGAQVDVGLGDGGCTGLSLTVLTVGDCPVATGNGPIVVSAGGSILAR